MNGALQLQVLGETQVLVGDSEAKLGGRPAALLALLLLAAPRAVGRDAIIDALWGDAPPNSAVNAVQVYVSTIRSVVGHDKVVTAGNGYRLAPGISSDLEEFPAWCVARS